MSCELLLKPKLHCCGSVNIFLLILIRTFVKNRYPKLRTRIWEAIYYRYGRITESLIRIQEAS
jgi:hypothetical protein